MSKITQVMLCINGTHLVFPRTQIGAQPMHAFGLINGAREGNLEAQLEPRHPDSGYWVAWPPQRDVGRVHTHLPGVHSSC